MNLPFRWHIEIWREPRVDDAALRRIANHQASPQDWLELADGLAREHWREFDHASFAHFLENADVAYEDHSGEVAAPIIPTSLQ